MALNHSTCSTERERKTYKLWLLETRQSTDVPSSHNIKITLVVLLLYPSGAGCDAICSDIWNVKSCRVFAGSWQFLGERVYYSFTVLKFNLCFLLKVSWTEATQALCSRFVQYTATLGVCPFRLGYSKGGSIHSFIHGFWVWYSFVFSTTFELTERNNIQGNKYSTTFDKGLLILLRLI